MSIQPNDKQIQEFTNYILIIILTTYRKQFTPVIFGQTQIINSEK